MAIPKLTPVQERVLDPATRVVEAGPGTGKTGALVARFLLETERCADGVALLSFTNAAIDEVRLRAGASPEVLKAPNFVGTIDSFWHRFILSPWVSQEYRCQPRYHGTWALLPPARRCIRKPGVPGVGLRLDAFAPGEGNRAWLNPDLLTRPEAKYLAELEEVNARPWAEHEAWLRIRASMRRGVFSAPWARWATDRILRSSLGPNVATRLALRFGAVLVDEVQDCVGSELDFLRTLSSEGVRTVVVADPDQAIYEFRGSKPQLFLDYRDAASKDAVVELFENHRSTASICHVVSSLRCVGRSPIKPKAVAECPPIYVLKGTGPQQRETFESLLAEHRIGRGDAIVLAHAAADARRVSGRRAASKLDNATGLGVRLARSCCELRESPDTRVRAAAIRETEQVLLDLLAWPRALMVGSKDVRLAYIDRDRSWLREVAAVFASSLPLDGTPAAFASQARSLAAGQLGGLPVLPRDLSACLKAPPEDRWKAALMVAEKDPSLRYDTVHGSKGKEYPAVLVVLVSKTDNNDNTVLGDWERGVNSEARRVLYVGASRAERLLALGAGAESARVAAQLVRDGVPHTVI